MADTEEKKTEEKSEPKAETPEPVKAKGGQEALVKASPKEEKEAKATSKEVSLLEEDELPEEADLIKLPLSALKKRLQRHTASQLKQEFGTSDLKEIKAKLDKYAELEKQEEERKRAQMTELEKHKEDLKKERMRRRDAERRERLSNHERLAEKGETRVMRAADAVGVDPDAHDALLPKFKTYLMSLEQKERASMSDKAIQKWFADQLKAKPKYAKDYVPSQVPLTTKKGGDGLPEKNDGSGGENPNESNFSPSSKNALSPAAARAAARARGLSWT